MSSEHGLGDDLRPEYDLTELMRSGIRGKYAARYRAGPVSLPGDSNGESKDPVGQFELTAEQEAKLEAAIAERERGNYVTLEQLFEQLRRDREGTSPPL